MRSALAVPFLIAITLSTTACKPPVITVTETPIKIQDDVEGHGDAVREGDLVEVNYLMTLPDGREVLRQDGYRFKVGVGAVIAGVDEAVVGMRQSGQRKFLCPPHKHWGRDGYGGGVIPPATDLTIRLTLVRIEGRAQRRQGVIASGGPVESPRDDP